jgi:nitrite reductase/ring-hydroxylating ferredoxin subunit
MNPPEDEQKTVAPDGRPMAEQAAWRVAFPIDVAQEHYVERRDFTKFLGLTSLGFVVGQFCIIALNWSRRRQGKPPLRPIGFVDELQVGDVRPFHYPGEEDACLLICLGPGSFVAYDQKCTHLSCAVVPDKDKNCLHCPCHHGCFDGATGRPIAGPPRRPLARIQLQITGNVIYATDVEYRSA